MDTQMIVLSGIDGSGKSTLMRHLKDYAAANGHDDWLFLDLWQRGFETGLIQDKDTIMSAMYAMDDDERGFFIADLVYQIVDSFEDADARLVFVDSYWFKYAAHEIARGHEIPHYEAYFTCEDRVKHVFHISTAASTAWDRKQPDVSRYECGGLDISRENFIRQQTQVDKEIRSLISAYPSTVLPEGATSEQWRDVVVDALETGEPV